MQTKAIWAALAVLCAAKAALAEQCNKPLKLVGSLPMTQWRKSPLVTIPVSLNGVEKQFLFDTGGYFTQIAPAVADELKIPMRYSNVELYAVDGSVSRNEVIVEKFGLGPLHAENYEILVSPDAGFEGIFSPMGYKTVDFDVDFSGAKVNILLSDHCEGRIFYWPHQTSAAIPFTNQENKITVPVTLDGKEFKAIIDTGASTSTIRMERAESIFDLHPGSPDMTVIGHVGNDQNAPIFAYPFKTLTFGDITVTNPHVLIFTDIMNKNADHSATTESRTKRVSDDFTMPDVIVGMDVLRKLHLYLAQKEGKLYLTEASAPASAPAPTPATTPAAAPADAPK